MLVDCVASLLYDIRVTKSLGEAECHIKKNELLF